MEVKKVGIIGPTEPQDSYIRGQLQREVRELVTRTIDAGSMVVVKMSNELTPMIIGAVIERDPTLEHLTVILPTRRDVYSGNMLAAARGGYGDRDKAESTRGLLETISHVRPDALVQLDAPRLSEEAYAQETRKFMRVIDEMEFLAVGIQLDNVSGVRRAPVENASEVSRALDQGVPVHITNIVS